MLPLPRTRVSPMLRGQLVLALLALSLPTSWQRSKEGSPCPEQVSGGLLGGSSCVRLSRCPAEVRRVLSGLPPVMCQSRPEPLVCCRNPIRDHVRDHVRDPIRDPIRDSIRDPIRDYQGRDAVAGPAGQQGAEGDVWFPEAAAYTTSTRRPSEEHHHPVNQYRPGRPAQQADGEHGSPSRTTPRPQDYHNSHHRGSSASWTGSRRPSKPTDYDYSGNDFLLTTKRPGHRPASSHHNRVPADVDANGQGNRGGWTSETRPSSSRPVVAGPPTLSPADYASRPGHAPRPARPGWISEKKCAEYARLQTERVVALPLVPDPRPVVQHVQKCDSNSVPLVVGGQDARLHEFPHMAAIGYRGAGPAARIEWNCGGSLISEMFVLTAAHCTATAQGPPLRVRLGEHNLESADDGARPVDVAVSSMVRHPDYQPPSRYHDIGLLRLARRVPFSAAIRPACLYAADQEPVAEPAVATGWGHTEQLGEKSQVLQKVNLNFVEHETCSNLYAADSSTSSLSRGIAADSQVCAGNLNGGKDTCQGDSGGPLQVTSHNNKCVFHIVGITSFGKVCAARNSPGVYTRVSKYISWIERHVWPEERWEN